ncbi:MAG: CRISPR-associated helicase Cas3' [Dictyoglomaceae bacterium]
MNEIWAKSCGESKEKITLSKHTSDALEAFENIKKKLNEEDSNLIEAVKFAIFLHDLGKVLPSFQIKSLGNKYYEPWDIYYEVPHSLFSIFWIDRDKLKAKFGEDYFNFIISAIAYHHWRENFDDLISRDNEMFIKLSQKVAEEWGEVLKENLYQELSDFGEYRNFVDLNKKWIEGVLNRRSLINFAIPPYKFDYEPLRKEVKKDWILIAGFLQRCDHFASWCENEGEELNKVEIEPQAEDEIKKKVAEKDVGNRKIGYDAWQFKELEDKVDKNIILIAPTGCGKTEFAFLWSKEDKFLYTLPIRSAVNQIYKRSEEIFGEHKVGLLHSDADIYLLDKNSDETGTMKLYDLAKQLSYPVMISTGDQFFPYALRPPGYEKLFATLSYSRLVIDEVQAYDPKACAIITKFIEWVYKMGGKFLLMTATLPKFIEDKIQELIPESDYEIVNIYNKEKKDFQKIFKHKLKIELIKNKKENNSISLELPDDILKDIIREAEDGKRVLVILNTINSAQKVFEKLKEKASALEDNIFLLHSRFTINDRKEKETEYMEKFKNPKPKDENIGKILVATQVVEASLEIDADVLFTEICPLDALVQRMGRVVRRYFYMDGKVINKSDDKEYEIPEEGFRTFENDPNVHIWVFKEGFQSGGKKVYSEELIRFSLAWLLKKYKEKDIDYLLDKIGTLDTKDYDNQLESFFEEEFSSILGSNPKGKSSIYRKILDDDWIDEVKDIGIELSEYDKYLLVSLFYASLKREGNYLREFVNTNNVLEAGWMSERKSEAQRIFREIYDVQVVSEDKLEEFKNKIIDFIEEEKANGQRRSLFTHFKQKVLSNYVLSIPNYWLKYPTPVYKRLESELKEEWKKRLETNLEEEWEKRLERWLSGIYVCHGKYDEIVGLIRHQNNKD